MFGRNFPTSPHECTLVVLSRSCGIRLGIVYIVYVQERAIGAQGRGYSRVKLPPPLEHPEFGNFGASSHERNLVVLSRSFGIRLGIVNIIHVQERAFGAQWRCVFLDIPSPWVLHWVHPTKLACKEGKCALGMGMLLL